MPFSFHICQKAIKSRKNVITMKVGVLGPAGTFSHSAALEYFENKDVELVFYPSIVSMIEAADKGECHLAFAPIENSLEGVVNATMDCLASDVALYIFNEYNARIHQCLMALDSASLTEIVSHPQPLGQCAYFLKQHPEIKLTVCDSTAEGGKIASQSPGVGVIGSKSLSQLYHLTVLAENIEDNDSNSTRFVVLSKQFHQPTGYDKTSIVFSICDKPGELIKLLSILDIFDLNMTKIESRPAKTILGEYLFFIDLDGHVEDENVKDALDVIKKKTTWFKLLGSYPKKPIDGNPEKLYNGIR